LEPSKTTSDVERDCNTCTHHVQNARSIDDAPGHCWNCGRSKSLPNWEPIEPPKPHLKGLQPHTVVVDDVAESPVLSAAAILETASETLRERGVSRDKQQGERSMLQTVRIFNAMTGNVVTEEEGWKFMIALKCARMSGGRFHFDDYLDLVGYSGLLAECAANNQITKPTST
jgi:hypothetical protein